MFPDLKYFKKGFQFGDMEHREMKVQLNSIHEKVSEQCFEM
jgi:hypothetical protein